MSYTRNRFQRTKVRVNIAWEGQLIFNINLNDFSYTIEKTDIFYFAVDTTPHSSGFDLNEVMTDITYECSILVEWFGDNYLTLINVT